MEKAHVSLSELGGHLWTRPHISKSKNIGCESSGVGDSDSAGDCSLHLACSSWLHFPPHCIGSGGFRKGSLLSSESKPPRAPAQGAHGPAVVLYASLVALLAAVDVGVW